MITFTPVALWHLEFKIVGTHLPLVKGAFRWAALLLLLMLVGSIELYAPSRARAGEEVEVVALVNGVKAPGELVVVSPEGNVETYDGGYARFSVDEGGEWRVEYAGVVKRIAVEESTVHALAEPLAYFALVVALLIIASAFVKSRRKLFIRKRFDGGVVSIEVRNNREELVGVRVVDPVPEDAELDLPKGAREREGLNGRSVVWSIPVLRAGQRIVLRYGIKTSAKVLPGAEVRASHALEIRAASDGVHT